MEHRLRAAALSRFGSLLILLAAAAAAAQGIEVTPLPPPEEERPASASDPDGGVVSMPLTDGHPPDLPGHRPWFAELRGLDKVTGRTRPLRVPVGGETPFGRLRIAVKACHGRDPDDPPEAAAFLQIFDILGQEERLVFSGWMFASSPGLSAMDHARYDIWVHQCKTS